MAQTVEITLVTNDGAGFGRKIPVVVGTTAAQFFAGHVNGNPNRYKIRVNRLEVAGDYVLQDGDRFTATPTKIEGARRCSQGSRGGQIRRAA